MAPDIYEKNVDTLSIVLDPGRPSASGTHPYIEF